MTGMIALWIGSLMLAVVMDAAVNARLAAQAVRRHERRMVEDVAARSAAEFAAMLLQCDGDRSRDGLGDVWATASLPDTGAYRGVWPDGARMVVTDLERLPEAALSAQALMPPPGSWRPRWMNVLTASSDAWEALGISHSGACGLVDLASRGIRDEEQVTSAPGLSGPDAQTLARVLQRGALGVRSELFRVRYSAPRPGGRDVTPGWMTGRGETDSRETCVEILLRREPARGGIAMISMRRISE